MCMPLSSWVAKKAAIIFILKLIAISRIPGKGTMKMRKRRGKRSSFTANGPKAAQTNPYKTPNKARPETKCTCHRFAKT